MFEEDMVQYPVTPVGLPAFNALGSAAVLGYFTETRFTGFRTVCLRHSQEVV